MTSTPKAKGRPEEISFLSLSNRRLCDVVCDLVLSCDLNDFNCVVLLW